MSILMADLHVYNPYPLFSIKNFTVTFFERQKWLYTWFPYVPLPISEILGPPLHKPITCGSKMNSNLQVAYQVSNKIKII
jgi:hypothetical protein